MKHLLAIMCIMLMTSMVAAQGTNPQRPGRTEMKKMPCHLLSGITERDYAIYLPGSYDEEPLRQYPVLYLMHGGGGSHTDWERANHLSQVTDSLISCGAIDDMIIVCPEGNQQNMMYFNSPTPNSAALGAPDWKYEDYIHLRGADPLHRTKLPRTHR